MIPGVRQYLTLCIAFAGALALTGCGGGGDDTTTTTETPTVTVQEPVTGPYSGDEYESCDTCHSDGRIADVTNYHGRTVVAAETNLVGNRITTTITNVTSNATGVVSVAFSAEDQSGAPFTTLSSVTMALAKLSNGNWVPYFMSTENDGSAWGHVINGASSEDTVQQASRDSGGVLTNNGDGTYVYTFNDQDLTDNTTPDADDPDGAGPVVPNTLIGFEPGLTHRVSLMTGGHSGATDQSFFDFVPDGSAVSDTRNIVSTTACQQCHGEEFHGHGGDRLMLEGCVTCHNPSTFDSGSGVDGEKPIMDAKVLFHKIHMGSRLPTTYELSHRGHTAEWSDLTFPADVQNCTKCHYEPTGETLADVDNWNTNPTRAACGSCHSDVNFATGENHPGGIRTNDSECATCHTPDGAITPYVFPVKTVHAIARTYTYDVALTMTPPAAGGYYVAGEAPLVTIVLSDPTTGTPIDHTTITEANFHHSNRSQSGSAYLFVNGPRAERKPVLTTAAANHTGSYANNVLYRHTNAADDDPKVAWYADRIEYQLDAIPADMEPGTYIAYVHAQSNAGKAAGNIDSVQLVTFQVGTATEELPIATGCTNCHADTLMHGSRPFDVDYCGACHDYEAQLTAVEGSGGTIWKGGGANNQGFGAAPISRRVHGVHNGVNLNYPEEVHNTYDYSHVVFPQNVKMCQTCHADGVTSGTWATNANRLACNGCHDSDDATGHTMLMTWDPTP